MPAMKISLDTRAGTLTVETPEGPKTLSLYSPEGFDWLSRAWLKVGWNQKHPYTFTWLGRPVIQEPEDMLRAQEVVFCVRPTVIVETGIAHGGSLIFNASLLQMMGGGRVIGVDVEIRPHNRAAIEAHPMFRHITLIEGDSAAADVVAQVRALLKPKDRVMVFLDSNHSYEHVTRELNAYAPLVSAGSYLVATDGSMAFLTEVPRGNPAWDTDNPMTAAADFAQTHTEFVLEQPAWLFNESDLSTPITHWPGAWLRRK